MLPTACLKVNCQYKQRVTEWMNLYNKMIRLVSLEKDTHNLSSCGVFAVIKCTTSAECSSVGKPQLVITVTVKVKETHLVN